MIVFTIVNRSHHQDLSANAFPSTTPEFDNDYSTSTEFDDDYSTSTEFNDDNSTLICDSQACQEAAKLITENMKTSVDPCDDFYDFACGNYATHHPIPDDKQKVATFGLLSESIKERVSKVIESKETDIKSSAILFTKKLYDMCVDVDALESQGLEPLRELLIGFGDWRQGNQQSDTWLQIAKVRAHFKDSNFNDILMNVQSNPDPYEPSVNVWTLSSPYVFPISRQDLVNDTDEKAQKNRQAYKEFIIKTANLFEAKKVAEQADKIIEFEKKLALASTPPGTVRDPLETQKKFSLKQLQEKIKDINWSQFFQNLLLESKILNNVADDVIIITDLPYFEKLGKIVKETEPNVVQNYLGLRVLNMLGFLSTNEFRQNLFELAKVTNGIKGEPQQKDVCLRFLFNELQLIVGRLYVDDYFSDKEKEEGTKVVTNLQAAFFNQFNEMKWLDESTRTKAIEKLNNITKNVGFPAWIKDDTELDKLFPLVTPEDTNAIIEMQTLLKTMAKGNFQKIGKPVDLNKDWPMGPAIVNAMYSPEQNSISKSVS